MNAYMQLLRERGIAWLFFRSLYSIKIKALCAVPLCEKLFEKREQVVVRINLFEIDIGLLQETLRNLSEDKKRQLIQEADDACEGRIKGFSSYVLDYGWPIDWQINPMNGKSADGSKKWYRIPDFDPQRGDIKAIWEASRYSHFFLLARAFLLTDDKKFFKAYSEQLSDWLKKNPYSYGANFKCGQECALRMLCCLIVYPVFMSKMTERDTDNLKELVSRCYRKILSNFFYAHKCQNNNHTLSELAGMIAGAWCTDDRGRLKWAYRTLDKAILKQFSSDGGYVQQSFNYQRVALQDMEAVLRMSNVTGVHLSQTSKARILSSALQMYQCQDASGDMPNYGSNDGALVFPVTSCGYRDFSPCINTVYALLTGKRLYDHGFHDEELFWFGMHCDLPREQVDRESMAFDETGLYTLRTGDSWLMLAAKKKICHMDQNHLDIWVNGENVCCDSGTYSYADELGHELFSTRAHNTLYCEGEEQIKRLGAFAVYGQPERKKARGTKNSITSEICFESGYTHCRTVTVTSDGFIVLDEAKGPEGKPIDAKVLFHTPLDIRSKDDCEVFLGNNCLLVAQNPISIFKTKRSLYYLQQEDMNCVEISLTNGQALTKLLIQKDKGEKQND